MILADKIIRLRKKNNWSQEELAEKVNVSRQAVAKWEGAQTVPSLDKILQLGNLFGVTTDYLLKDDIEDEEFVDDSDNSNIKRVTLVEANEYLQWRKQASIGIAAATFLCILSVVPLLILGAVAEYFSFGISDTSAAVIGLCILIVMVAIAVGIFVFCYFHNTSYEFLDKDFFDTEYGVRGMVKEKQKDYKNTYIKFNIIGVCICIISPVSLFAGAFTENEFLMVIMLSVTIVLAGVGVMLLIVAGVRWASMQKLLNEGEFTVQGKRKSKIKESIGKIYWSIVTAAYLGWSFITNNWEITWIIWPVSAVLFAGAVSICNLFIYKES